MNHALKTIFIFTNDNVCVIIGITTEYHYISKPNYMEHSTVLFDNTSLFNIVFSACFSFSNTNQVYIKSFENVHFIHFWKFFFQLRNILFIQKLENAQILRNCNIKSTNIVQRATQK